MASYRNKPVIIEAGPSWTEPVLPEEAWHGT